MTLLIYFYATVIFSILLIDHLWLNYFQVSPLQMEIISLKMTVETLKTETENANSAFQLEIQHLEDNQIVLKETQKALSRNHEKLTDEIKTQQETIRHKQENETKQIESIQKKMEQLNKTIKAVEANVLEIKLIHVTLLQLLKVSNETKETGKRGNLTLHTIERLGTALKGNREEMLMVKEHLKATQQDVLDLKTQLENSLGNYQILETALSEIQRETKVIRENTFNKDALIMAIFLMLVLLFMLAFAVYKLWYRGVNIEKKKSD